MGIKRLGQSFRNAFSGLKHVFKTEQNFRVQSVVAIFVLLAIICFPLRAWEIVLLVLLVGMVLVMELLNTALEYFTDLLKPRLHNYVKIIKDIMAAAVLLTSLGALIIGLIILLPYFIRLFE